MEDLDRQNRTIERDGQRIELLPNHPSAKPRFLQVMHQKRLTSLAKLLALCVEDIQKSDAEKAVEQKSLIINILAQTDYILQIQTARAADDFWSKNTPNQ